VRSTLDCDVRAVLSGFAAFPLLTTSSGALHPSTSSRASRLSIANMSGNTSTDIWIVSHVSPSTRPTRVQRHQVACRQALPGHSRSTCWSTR
jgi:hypothetical protein